MKHLGDDVVRVILTNKHTGEQLEHRVGSEYPAGKLKSAVCKHTLREQPSKVALYLKKRNGSGFVPADTFDSSYPGSVKNWVNIPFNWRAQTLDDVIELTYEVVEEEKKKVKPRGRVAKPSNRNAKVPLGAVFRSTEVCEDVSSYHINV